MKKAAVVIGASSGLGKELAYVLAANGLNLILSARDLRDLEAIANDLKFRFNITAKASRIDLEKLDRKKSLEFVSDCFNDFKEINQVYITAGIIKNEDYGLESAIVLDEMMSINFIGIAYLVESFSQKLKNKDSNITVVSSIAAIRPRSRNIAYTASKIALEYFVGGLQHYLRGNLLRLQIYRLGYMDTQMTANKKLLLPIAKPGKVANFIYNNRNENFNMKYYPRFWVFIAIIIKTLPWNMFKNINQ